LYGALLANAASMDDPIDALLEEHALQRGVFGALDFETTHLEQGPSQYPFWDDAVLFLREFVTERHRRKEEEVLFLLLVQRGLRDRGGPIGIVRAERADANDLIQALGAVVDERRPDAIGPIWRECTALLRGHLQREESFLFPPARQLLEPVDLSRLQRGCARIDREADRLHPRSELVEIASRIRSRWRVREPTEDKIRPHGNPQ
jgi:hemerythrin-like domain-containing protein